MKRALIVCGSARPDGVTLCMCTSAGEHLASMGYDVETVLPHTMDLRHCTDCGACAGGPCVIDDDMDRVYGLFREADLLVLTSPVHFSGPSSLIKTFLDRFQPYWYDRDLPHPAGVVALLCGGGPEPRFDNTVSILRAFSITTRMDWLGHMGFPDTDRVGSDGAPEAVRSFLDSVLRP